MLYRGLAAINKIKPGAAVAIGNFDGMHIGHKKLLATLKETAKQYDTESLVILFEPHPKEYFNKQGTCSRIMSLKEKYLYLRQYGIDLVLCLRFNSQLLNTSHQIFFNSILKDQLQVQALILGSNFCFGKNRLGNIDYLKSESRLNNIDLHVIQSCVVNKKVVSSTYLRQVLREANFSLFRELTGFSFSITGKIRFSSIGESITKSPQCYISLGPNSLPLDGVYKVRFSSADYTKVLQVQIKNYPGSLGYNKRIIIFSPPLVTSEKLSGIASLVFIDRLSKVNVEEDELSLGV